MKMKAAKAGGLPMHQALNPSGLVQKYHNTKCKDKNGRRSLKELPICICSLGVTLRQKLDYRALLATPEWRGSVAFPQGGDVVLQHPSGATATLKNQTFGG